MFRSLFGESINTTGGNILAHSSKYKVCLGNSGETRVTKMMNSPYHPGNFLAAQALKQNVLYLNCLLPKLISVINTGMLVVTPSL
jgi:hypothetical protein